MGSSGAELLKKQKDDTLQHAMPVFLTEAQRQQSVLQRLEEEVAESKKWLEDQRRELAIAAESRRKQQEEREREMREREGERERRERERERDEEVKQRERDRAEKQAQRERGKELEAIKEQDLGSKKPKKRVVKPSEKFRFSFDWQNTEDTSRDMNGLYQNPHEVQLLFGRGFHARHILETQPPPVLTRPDKIRRTTEVDRPGSPMSQFQAAGLNLTSDYRNLQGRLAQTKGESEQMSKEVQKLKAELQTEGTKAEQYIGKMEEAIIASKELKKLYEVMKIKSEEDDRALEEKEKALEEEREKTIEAQKAMENQRETLENLQKAIEGQQGEAEVQKRTFEDQLRVLRAMAEEEKARSTEAERMHEEKYKALQTETDLAITAAASRTRAAEDSEGVIKEVAKNLDASLRVAQGHALKLQYELTEKATSEPSSSTNLDPAATSRIKELKESLGDIATHMAYVFDNATTIRTPSESYIYLLNLAKTAFRAREIDVDEYISTPDMLKVMKKATPEELAILIFALYSGDIELQESSFTLYLHDHPATYCYKAWLAIMANTTDLCGDLMEPSVRWGIVWTSILTSRSEVDEQIQALRDTFPAARAISDRLHHLASTHNSPSAYFPGGLLILLARVMDAVDSADMENVLKDVHIQWPTNEMAQAEKAALDMMYADMDPTNSFDYDVDFATALFNRESDKSTKAAGKKAAEPSTGTKNKGPQEAPTTASFVLL